MKRWITLCLGLCALTAQAQEAAYTLHATEMKAKPFSDAQTVAKLAEHAQVEIIERQASWMQVKAAGATGWVKFLGLRLGDGSATGKGGDGSGLKALFNVAATGKSGSTTTTGVRGLSEESLKKAVANPEALKAVQDYAVSKDDAQDFAKAGALKEQQMDYLAVPGKGGK